MKGDNLRSCAGTYLARRKTLENLHSEKILPPKMLQSIRQYRLLPVLIEMRSRAINDYRCVISIPAKDRLSRGAFMGSRIV